MFKEKPMEKGKEEATSSSSSSSKNSIEEEDEEINEKACNYEQQRLSRIRENRARLEALGLPSLASSFLASSSSSKRHRPSKKKKKGDDDDEYRPSDDDEADQGDDDEADQGDDDDGDVVEDFYGPRVKGKKTSSSNASGVKKSSFLKRKQVYFDEIDDNAALQQAIALSLGRTAEDSVSFNGDEGGSIVRVKEGKANMQETAGRRKNKKMNKSRVQLSEDEVVAYFFSFDETGKGHISLQDLQRMVLAHDFSWSEMEIASMIHSFDSDRDGKLSLEDFRAIVSRCNMVKETGNC